MELDKIIKTIPSDREIEEAERHLAILRKSRDEAKRVIASAIKSDDILMSLGRDELASLLKRIQSRLTGQHRKVRGSRVPPELKDSLKEALMAGDRTLSQLGDMFNLSVSYISRVKRELGLTGVRNAYTDHPLKFNSKAVAGS